MSKKKSTTSASPQSPRDTPREQVLRCLKLRRRASRADLHRETGLTKPTVSKIADALVSEGLLIETGMLSSSSAGGRPSTCLELNPSWQAYAAIAMDTDRTRVALADFSGQVREVREGPPPTEDPKASLDAVVRQLRSALRRVEIPSDRLAGVGLTVPSLIDPRTGHCFLAPNLGWREFPLAETLAQRVQAPVRVANVPQAAALSESRWGAAREAEHFVWVYVGSGVGAGIMQSGEAFLGQRGLSGELGHCRVIEGGKRCGCGKTGCLETVASTQAMAEHFLELAKGGTKKVRRAESNAKALAQWRSALEAGDRGAKESVKWGARHLGLGLSFLMNLLDPELIVIGGHARTFGDDYLRELRSSTLEHSLAPERVNIRTSQLGGDAALWGALLAGAPRDFEPQVAELVRAKA